jgi:hypothetical protein
MSVTFSKIASTMAVAMMMSLTGGCNERIPLENTPELYKLHGIVNDGKTANEITLINDRNKNRPKLRFPPEIPVGVYTPETYNPDPTPIRKVLHIAQTLDWN